MTAPGDQFVLPASACPSCGYGLEACTNMGGTGGPRPGDVTLCGRCAAVLTFAGDLRVRAATEEELGAIPLDVYAHLQTVRTALLQMRIAKGLSDAGS